MYKASSIARASFMRYLKTGTSERHRHPHIDIHARQAVVLPPYVVVSAAGATLDPAGGGTTAAAVVTAAAGALEATLALGSGTASPLAPQIPASCKFCNQAPASNSLYARSTWYPPSTGTVSRTKMPTTGFTLATLSAGTVLVVFQRAVTEEQVCHICSCSKLIGGCLP